MTGVSFKATVEMLNCPRVEDAEDEEEDGGTSRVLELEIGDGGPSA